MDYQDTKARPSTRSLVADIRATNQDFEWYPTTAEILATIKADMEANAFFRASAPSVLDCGAGDGRALMALTDGDRYAIEKSHPLLEQIDASVFLVGTEFAQQTLIDKKVDVIFSNPPYSEYAQWMEKIIREANAAIIYFIVPERWKDNELIGAALTRREAEAQIIGSFDFLNAERQARAKVSVLRVDLAYHRHYSNHTKVDPFTAWFEDNFKLQINNDKTSKYEWESRTEGRVKARVSQELVAGSDLVSALESLYQSELAALMDNYKALEHIDADLLRELDVNLSSLRGAMRQKIEGLKDRFWRELFENINKVTDRLCHREREQMLEKLTSNTHIDFTADNAYAVLLWAIKNANGYLDGQIIRVVTRMTEYASVTLYKSNQKTFGNEEWRYCARPEGLDRYGLDYRIVLHHAGGINNSEWLHERKENGGLNRSAYELINDILTVANNIGFDTTQTKRAGGYEWTSGSPIIFEYRDHAKAKSAELMKVKAFKNGNLHINFNQAFICRLNVEFGRLKGWIKDHKEAAQELDIPSGMAADAFGSNMSLPTTNVLMLCAA